MEFVREPYIPGETIAAIATPIGDGGVAIIRISGKEAILVADRVFSGNVKLYLSHTAHFGQVVNAKGEKVDDALLLVMKEGRSYTGEDTVEIQCHGGTLITRAVLETVLQAGARQAKPGEFTFQAFMNGKMDLSQAEALQMMIGAKNELCLKHAEKQLSGRLSNKIQAFQKELTHLAAIIEAWVDFPEEGLEFLSIEELLKKLTFVTHQMELLASSFHDGQLLKQGLAICLVGCPNSGKSSLMNALLNKNRAIVSPYAGTTRDLIEEEARIAGLHLRLIDTAGIRTSEDVIEQEGIKRTKDAMEEADLILVVLDAHRGILEEEKRLFQELPQKKTIAVWNKIDLIEKVHFPPLPFEHIAPISALQKKGLDTLSSLIDRVIFQGGAPSKEEAIITQNRHYEALTYAIAACREVIQGLKEELSPEFLACGMKTSLIELGKILGTNVTEDVLTSIFSTFCIGK